ncbi:hypothetical protein H6763_00305 [Candidatus Nomurabacteria bacterium]|nr:hypothetical protein [Candidatus Nomurabacteria bacterium]MCB9803257.1 hypothetical protein [Candidatus Nomurabacteria bacterium]
MKVIHTIDKNIDIKMVYTMLKSNDPSGNWNRASSMGIERGLFDLITKSESFRDVKYILSNLYDEKYLRDKKLLFSMKKEFQNGWKEINDIFEKETENVVGKDWKYKEYKVIVSLFHPGVSNMLGDIVYLWIYDDLDVHLRITAHELLMTHIWQYLFKRFSEKEIYSNWNKYWSINEITTTYILGIEPKLNSLWSERMKGYENFLQNYPQLKESRDTLVEKYKNRETFDEFVDYALTLF